MLRFVLIGSLFLPSIQSWREKKDQYLLFHTPPQAGAYPPALLHIHPKAFAWPRTTSAGELPAVLFVPSHRAAHHRISGAPTLPGTPSPVLFQRALLYPAGSQSFHPAPGHRRPQTAPQLRAGTKPSPPTPPAQRSLNATARQKYQPKRKPWPVLLPLH